MKPTGEIKGNGYAQGGLLDKISAAAKRFNVPSQIVSQPPTEPMNQAKGKRVQVTSPLLTRKQLALILQVSEQTVKKRAGMGLIKQVDVCGKIRYPADLNKVSDYIEIV